MLANLNARAQFRKRVVLLQSLPEVIRNIDTIPSHNDIIPLGDVVSACYYSDTDTIIIDSHAHICIRCSGSEKGFRHRCIALSSPLEAICSHQKRMRWFLRGFPSRLYFEPVVCTSRSLVILKWWYCSTDSYRSEKLINGAAWKYLRNLRALSSAMYGNHSQNLDSNALSYHMATGAKKIERQFWSVRSNENNWNEYGVEVLQTS